MLLERNGVGQARAQILEFTALGLEPGPHSLGVLEPRLKTEQFTLQNGGFFGGAPGVQQTTQAVHFTFCFLKFGARGFQIHHPGLQGSHFLLRGSQLTHCVGVALASGLELADLA